MPFYPASHYPLACALCRDQSVSNRLKEAIELAHFQDPVDALAEAELLRAVCEERLRHLQDLAPAVYKTSGQEASS